MRYLKYEDPHWLTVRRLMEEVGRINGKFGRLERRANQILRRMLCHVVINPVWPLLLLEEPSLQELWNTTFPHPPDPRYFESVRRSGEIAVERGLFTFCPRKGRLNEMRRQTERYQCLICRCYVYEVWENHPKGGRGRTGWPAQEEHLRLMHPLHLTQGQSC